MKKEVAKSLFQKIIQNYNQISQNFAKARKEPWKEGKFLVEKFAKKGEKILDVGCGSGQWLNFFKEKEVEYFGVDVSEKLIEIAKKTQKEGTFLVGNCQNLPFEDNFFDKVYAIGVFHHLPSKELREQCLREIKRVLKNKGILILTVWNLWKNKKMRKLIFKFFLLKIIGKSNLDFKDILVDWWGMKDFYFHCFTKRELEKLVKKIGFKILKKGEFSVHLKKRKNENFYIVAQKI